MTGGAFELLSTVDAQLWYWDTPETPMMMGNVCVFEGDPLFDASGAFRLEDVRRWIESRLHLVPRYRQKVVKVPFSRPILVDDPHFDIANHVDVISLSEPGAEDQLKEVFARVHEGILDRSRPPWKIVFVRGLQDGRVAMIQKIHHAPFDGATSVRIMEALFGAAPKGGAIEQAPAWSPKPSPHVLEVMVKTIGQQVRAGWHLFCSDPLRPSLSPSHALESSKTLAAVRNFLPAAPTSLNRDVGPRRRFDWLSTTLGAVKHMRATVPGSTVNDVMLAAVAGGLRELFLARGEDLNGVRPRVMVPVDIRDDQARGTEPGNRFSALVFALPIAESDVVTRLTWISAEMTKLKAGRQAEALQFVMNSCDVLPPILLEAATWRRHNMRTFTNLTVTNVPGPRQELELLGAKMLELHPMIPLNNQLTLNVAVESYVDKLSIGMCCDPDAVPDLNAFVNGVSLALDELSARASAQPRL